MPEPDATDLSLETIAGEAAWMESLGVRYPERPLLLPRPFSEPLTNGSFVVPAAWHWRPPPEHVDARCLLRDLDILATAMAKAYAGWETAESAGWEWAEFFEQWKSGLSREQSPAMSLERAFAPWRELMRFQLDNHSGPVPGGAFQGLSRTLLLAEMPPEPVTAYRDDQGQNGPRDPKNPAHQPRTCLVFEDGQLTHGAAICHPSSLGEWDSVKAGPQWFAVRPARFDSGRTAPHAASSRMLAGRIGYLRIPTLGYLDVLRLISDRDWLAPGLAHARTLIFDVRGNQGGGAELLAYLLGEVLGIAQRPDATLSMRIKDSCVSRALGWGFAQARLHGVSGPLPHAVREQLQRTLNSIASAPPGCAVAFQAVTGRWRFGNRLDPDAAIPRLVVLTDNRCGSDGEFLVYLLAQTPGCVVAGVNTAGVGGFARPGHFVLPHTGVAFRLATALTDPYGDQRSFEGYGLNADVVLNVGEPLSDAHLVALAESIDATSEARKTSPG
ncbi:MAG: S41 family peptidase [Bryobacteraceae bacterium]